MSPLLSNLYLHEVLDVWFEHAAKPRLRGRAFEVRYADDAVLVFEHEEDARRAGGAGEAEGEVRTAPAPGQDPAGGLSPPGQAPARGNTARGSFTMLGFPHLLGTLQEGAMGGKAQDCQGLPPA